MKNEHSNVQKELVEVADKLLEEAARLTTLANEINRLNGHINHE